MNNGSTPIIFIIACFAFAIMIIFKREQIPERIRRPLALLAVIMVLIAFAVMIALLLT